MAQLMLFSGNATPELSKKVSDYLAVPLGNASVGRFSDGEIAVEIVENVRGQDVFVLQSTCAPTNDNLMELVVLCDALRRASASRITAVVPLLRLCPPRSTSTLRSCSDHGEGGG